MTRTTRCVTKALSCSPNSALCRGTIALANAQHWHTGFLYKAVRRMLQQQVCCVMADWGVDIVCHDQRHCVRCAQGMAAPAPPGKPAEADGLSSSPAGEQGVEHQESAALLQGRDGIAGPDTHSSPAAGQHAANGLSDRGPEDSAHSGAHSGLEAADRGLQGGAAPGDLAEGRAGDAGSGRAADNSEPESGAAAAAGGLGTAEGRRRGQVEVPSSAFGTAPGGDEQAQVSAPAADAAAVGRRPVWLREGGSSGGGRRLSRLRSAYSSIGGRLRGDLSRRGRLRLLLDKSPKYSAIPAGLEVGGGIAIYGKENNCASHKG